MDENKPRRRWLSFGIRDLLWAMVVMGLVIALIHERLGRGGMAPEWREIRETGLMARRVEAVTIEFWNGPDVRWTETRGVRELEE